MLYIEQIQVLFRQLMPRGRAFKGPVGGWLDGLNSALSVSENRAYLDALSTFDSMLADNENFTTQDATDWERRLGLIQYNPNPGFGYLPTLQDRKLAILQQYNFPGTTLARGFWYYIQTQLRAAGFDVYLYENRFWNGSNYVTKTPVEIAGGSGILGAQFGQWQFGQSQFGGTWGNIIVNYLSLSEDLSFFVNNNLRSTFFIGGPDITIPGTVYASVPVSRMQEFRALILHLKPVQTIGYLFINYV